MTLEEGCGRGVMKLYIIGNGFDRAHDLKTSYWDFRCYLARYAEEFLTELEKIYSFYPFDPNEFHVPASKQKDAIEHHNNALYDELWKNFEYELGQPSEGEFDTICDSTIEEMNDLESGPIGIIDTLNVYFEEQLGFVIELQDYLLRWARQIRLNKAVIKKDEMRSSTDLFLTFNYTPTLERVYGIPGSNICHIHGGIPPYCHTAPIIGHGNNESIDKWLKWKQENDDAFNEGGSAKCEAIANFYKRTLKDTSKQLMLNLEFFRRLNEIDEVVVIGHSLGDVDMPYFKRIVEITNIDTPWTILYHSEDEKDGMEIKARCLGLKNIKMLESDKYWDR